MLRISKQFPKKKAGAIKKQVQISERSSAEIKQSFAKLWLEEKPYARYIYEVERCDNGARIFLHRPTYKHGLDFAVSVEGFKSLLRKNNSTRPSHDDVIKDLRRKLTGFPSLREELFDAIGAIYRCQEPDDILRKCPRIRRAQCGLPIDQTLRIIKWLFIEQDVTYWLGTGRNMLMSAIERKAFRIAGSELFETK